MSNVKAIDGLPVIDAKRPVVLTVTKQDIDKADIKDPSRCAIALACIRELHVHEARIHLRRTYLRSNKGNWVRYETSPAMRNEIIAFDRGGTFEPREFTLTPLFPSNRAGARKLRKPSKSSSKNSKKSRNLMIKPYYTKNVRAGPA